MLKPIQIEKETKQSVMFEVDSEYAIAAKRKIESAIYSKLNVPVHASIEGISCDSTLLLIVRFISNDVVCGKVYEFIESHYQLT